MDFYGHKRTHAQRVLRTQRAFTSSMDFSGLCGRLETTDTYGTKRNQTDSLIYYAPSHFTVDKAAVLNMMVKCNLFFAAGDRYSTGRTF